MTRLDATHIREALSAAIATKLSSLEVLPEVESTNCFLMQQPGPPVGNTRVAVTDNQTAGRGRYGRTWQSPPGSGLCLSMAYTFATPPTNLPALTLATGIGVVEILHELQFVDVRLKWPNDLVAMGGKLGGILTEAQTQPSGVVMVVTGLGLNIDLGDRADLVVEEDWASRIVDLRSLAAEPPCRNRLTAKLVTKLSEVLADYEVSGFANVWGLWPEHDWLFGREVTIDTAGRQLTGVAAGIADDGALLVETRDSGTLRIASGSVTMVGSRKDGQ